MNQDQLKKIAKSTLFTAALAVGVNIIANDITPGSWEASAMSKNSEKQDKSAETNCGGSQCGADKAVEKKMEKGAESKCSAEIKKKKAKAKGSDSSCGAETCGA